MNPMLLLLLAGGGAVVAKKVYDNVVDCRQQTPVANPFYDASYNLDYAKISKALTEAAKDRRAQKDKKVQAYANGAAAIAAAVPVYGQIAAVAIIAAGMIYGAADKFIADHFGDDPNKQLYADQLASISRDWVAFGALPPHPGPTDSLKALCENARDGLISIRDNTEPYFKSIAKSTGEMFKKWGGHPYAIPYAAYFTSDENGMLIGSMPTWRDFNLEHNVPRLKLAAMTYALEYGVQCQFDAVLEAALAAAASAPSSLAFLPNNADPSWLELHAFLAGVHGAASKARALAKLPLPPPINASTIQYADGGIGAQKVVSQKTIRGPALGIDTQAVADQAAVEAEKKKGLPGWGSGTWAK